MRLALALLAVLAATARADSPAPPPSPPPPPPQALRDALAARAGKSPVYLVFGEDGLAAAPADGGWSAPLVEGAVAAAALDAAMDLLWLVREGRLEVLDLREPAPKPVTIVNRWAIPVEAYASTVLIEVSGVSNASTDNTYGGVYPTLVWAAKPKIKTAEGAYGGIWEDQDANQKKAIKKAKIVGQAWLAAQAARKPRAVKDAVAPKQLPKVKLPDGLGECEDEEMCGDAVPFGPTPWTLVIAAHACGDACHTDCVLYDPKSKKFASPTAPAKWDKTAERASCRGYVFDAGGTRYLAGDQLCTAAGCAAVKGGTAFDWLDGHAARL